jgi:hypothetical protein
MSAHPFNGHVARETALAQLRGELAFASREYACAEMIDETRRMQEQRRVWSGRIKRLEAMIAELEAKE